MLGIASSIILMTLIGGDRVHFNPLNPNIKIQILICYPYTFSIEVVGRIY